MSKGSGGTRATNSRTAHGGGANSGNTRSMNSSTAQQTIKGGMVTSNSSQADRIKDLQAIAKKAGESQSSVYDNGGRYVNVGSSVNTANGVYQRQEYRRDVPQIRIKSDNYFDAHELTVQHTENGYELYENGGREGRYGITRPLRTDDKRKIIAEIKKFRNYYNK